MNKLKIIRSTTVPMSLNTFCRSTLCELSEHYEVIALSSPGPALEEIKEREGVRIIAVPMERRISLSKDLVSLWRLIRVFSKERPYMVHSMTPKAGLLCMMAAWLTKVPVRVHTFTGLVFPTASGLKRRILMFTDGLTCACATHIIPEGEGVKNDLQKNGITKKPLKVLGYGNVRGINLAHYDCTLEVMAEAAGIRRSELFTFVFVGRICGEKGINELVKAFDRLHQELPATRLILIGGNETTIDPILPWTSEQIKQGDGIEYVGQQSDVRPWLAASDALVFPSYREGFPNVVIEAGAMGLPSIVTDINGSREIIIEEKNGTIVPPHDAELLYNAMLRFATDRTVSANMAANARKLVADRYEDTFVRKCLYQYYSEIMN